MTYTFRGLRSSDSKAIIDLLDQSPETNLYARDLVDRQGIDLLGLHRWTGAFENDALIAVNLDVACIPNQPCKLSVPMGRADACEGMGRLTLERGGCERIMAERSPADAFWIGLGQPVPSINHAQDVMYIKERSEGEHLNIRPATPEMFPILFESTALMRLEEEGMDPRIQDPDLWLQTIQILIARRLIWVAFDKGELCFVIEIGTRCQRGAQIGSTYVPPNKRGQGMATRGMRAIVNQLLSSSNCVTLLVKEENVPARKCYERVGFQYGDPYRLYSFQEIKEV